MKLLYLSTMSRTTTEVFPLIKSPVINKFQSHMTPRDAPCRPHMVLPSNFHLNHKIVHPASNLTQTHARVLTLSKSLWERDL